MRDPQRFDGAPADDDHVLFPAALGYRVTGTDLSAQAVARARAEVAARRLPVTRRRPTCASSTRWWGGASTR